MTAQVFLRCILPGLLFIPLAGFGHHVMLAGMKRSGAAPALLAQCQNTSVLTGMKTGLAPADTTLCILTMFFQSVFTSAARPLLWDLGTSLSVLVVHPFIESARAGRARVFAWPVLPVFGMLYQLQGAGVWFQLFWLALVLSGHATMRRGPVDRAAAEASLFALLAGFALPSQVMLTFYHPLATAAWQLFPIWMTILRAVYIAVRRRATRTGGRGDGHAIVQATYLVAFALSAFGHAYALWLSGHGPIAYAATLIVPVNPPAFDGSAGALTAAAVHFLKWDTVLTVIGATLATFWLTGSRKELVWMGVWNACLTPLFGVGATVSGALMWREQRMHG